MARSEKFRLAAIAAICLLYASVRLWNLTASCLWFDEIFSVHAAEHDWTSLFWFVAQDLIHPPLFYVLLKIWIGIGGENLFWLRLFSVVFSTAALAPFCLLCRQLKINFSTLALALAFFAVNGALIKYAQEVRMYGVLLCFSLASLWLFVRFLNSGKGFAALTIINVLLVYTHYFGWLIVLNEIVAVAIFQRANLKRIFIMTAAAAISFLPWVLMIWRASRLNADFGQNLGWAEKPNAETVLQFVFDLLEPFYFQQTSADPTTIRFITVPLLILLLTALVLFVFGRKNLSEIEKRTTNLLTIFCFAPLTVAFLASWLLPVSVWGTRHLIIIFAPALILPASALVKIPNLYAKLTVAALVFWLTGIAFLLQIQRGAPVSIDCAWANLAANLRANHSDSRLKIYAFEDVVAYDLWFALRTEKARFQIVKVGGISGIGEDTAYFLPRGFDEVPKISEADLNGERFFVAFRDSEWNTSKAPLGNLLEKGYRIGEPQVFEARGIKAFLVEVGK